MSPVSLSSANAVQRTLLRAAPLVVALAALTACAGERPVPTNSPSLDSGITSSNGGGARTLGNAPSVGITSGSPGR